MPTEHTLEARRRIVAPAGVDVHDWLRRAARRGDTVLLDLGDSAISLLRVRDIVAWTLEARARSIKVVIIGKVWHRAALSSLTRHDMPGQDLPALWSNE